jgi:hypothetical protein
LTLLELSRKGHHEAMCWMWRRQGGHSDPLKYGKFLNLQVTSVEHMQCAAIWHTAEAIG